METADSSPPAEVSRVAQRLPPFWAKRPAVWFAQAEAQFFLAAVKSENVKKVAENINPSHNTVMKWAEEIASDVSTTNILSRNTQ
jgi:hypothetical protein